MRLKSVLSAGSTPARATIFEEVVMDVYSACLLSSLGQAGYEDKWGNIYLAEFHTGDSLASFWVRKRKGNWKMCLSFSIENKVRDRWRPIAPK